MTDKFHVPILSQLLRTFPYRHVESPLVVGLRGELQRGKKYVVKTARGPYVLCQRCYKTLGLPLIDFILASKTLIN
jgi:hypothetical protein